MGAVLDTTVFINLERSTTHRGQAVSGDLLGRRLTERLDLPHRGSTDEDLRIHVEPILGRRVERVIVGKPPQHDMRIEQQRHDAMPKSRATASFVSAESQPRANAIFPRSEPRLDRRTDESRRTTFATGRPSRLMTISSPASTRATIRDSCVFASWILNCAAPPAITKP